MIVACPLCQTRFLVPANLFEGGPRQMRCARCKHSWRAEVSKEGLPELIEAATPSTPPPDSTLPSFMMETPPAAEKQPPSVLVQRIRQVGAAILLGVFLFILVFDRQNIAANHPDIEGLYDDVGLTIFHHGGEGLSFEDVRSELRFDSGLMKLTVTGKISNSTRFEEEIPNILASAIGPDGKILQSWQIDAPASKVVGGASVPFQSAINAPKGTVVDLNLAFIQPQKEP